MKEEKTAEVGKIQTGSFTLANLDKEATEFYRVSKPEEQITSLTQIRSETSVTETKDVEYLALNSDGTYTLWTVSYYIIPNTAKANYKLVDDDRTFASEIGGSGTIYILGDNGILTLLDSTSKPTDNLVVLKTVIIDGDDISRNTYYFTVYKDEISVTAEVNAYSSGNPLSSILDRKVWNELGISSADTSYYLYNNETGEKPQITLKSFENIPDDGLKETYYTKVGNEYYLVEVTYMQKQSLEE